MLLTFSWDFSSIPRVAHELWELKFFLPQKQNKRKNNKKEIVEETFCKQSIFR